MDIAVESDTYEPHMNDEGYYVDYIPTSSMFSNGIRCPCGTRKNYPFTNRQNFKIHVKTTTHTKWLSNLNSNKINYYSENTNLKDIVRNQQIIIANKDNKINELIAELSVKSKTIDLLTQQIVSQVPTSREANLLYLD